MAITLLNALALNANYVKLVEGRLILSVCDKNIAKILFLPTIFTIMAIFDEITELRDYRERLR